MNKKCILLICAILFSSCSVLNLGEAATLAPTITNTFTEAPSAAPATPTLTFTTTPTLIVIPKTDTPTADVTVTPLIETPLFLVTPKTPTPSPQMEGFLTVSVSAKEFYKGNQCQPTSVRFTAQVADIGNTGYVLLFARFKSKVTGASGDWADSIAMQSIGAGTFVHDLVVTEMKNLGNFKNAWVEYQFVATNSNGREIGRTDIFKERLTLLECTSTPTPEVSPIPTLLKP